MRLLCVSHACVVPANQALFARVARQTGWDVTIVAPRRWRNELGAFHVERWPEFEGELVALAVVGSGRVPLHFYGRGLAALVRRIRPSAMFAHNEPYALATAQVVHAARGVPAGFYSAQNVVKRYPAPVRALERYVHERAAFAFATSASALVALRSRGYDGDATVVPLWVDLDRYSISQRRDRSHSLVVGFVGRLVPEKGADVLLEALASLPGDVRAVFAGAGDDAVRLRRHARKLRLDARVDWRGYVPHDQMPNLYGEIDVLVVPSRTTISWKEQFGRVVVEALAAGVPVVASDCGSLPALLERTGGWLVREGDAQALAQRLLALRNDAASLRRAGEQGCTAVKAQFGLDAVARRFAAGIETAIACDSGTRISIIAAGSS
ncbi:MAG: glycosyltransferase family 4 protein [Gaiellaceae bacterium]